MVTKSYSKIGGKWWSVRFPNTFLRLLVTCALVMCDLVAEGATSKGSESKTAYACEDGQLVLTCQVGEVIRILRANYGRFTISVCNRHGQTEGWNLQCMSSKAKDIISERCDGRRECDMRVSNLVFGDPCPSTSKYAEVKYTCHLAHNETLHIQTTMTSVIPVQPVMPLNGSPRPPQMTSVTALSPSQVEIVWIQAKPTSPITTTAVYLKDIAMETEPSPLYTKSEGSLIIEKLRPNTTYIIYLKSFNNHGPSMNSNIVSVTTPPLDESTLVSATVRTDMPRPDFLDVSTKQPSHSSTDLDGIKVTTATTAQPATQAPELLPPDVDLSSYDYSSHDYSPNDPGVPLNRDDSDEVINGVVDKFCEEKIYRGVVWPQTQYGRQVENNCPEDLRGTATWQCLDYGWEKPGPDLSDCTSAWVDKMDTQINKVMRGEEPADQAAVALNEAMMGQEFTSGDLKKVSVKLLPKLAKSLERDDPTEPIVNRMRRMKKFKKAFMSTSSDLLSKKNFQSWRSLSRQDRRRAVTFLVLAIEDIGFHTARLMDIGSSEVTVNENIVMEVTVIDSQQTHNDITFPSRSDLWEAETVSDSITISSTSLKIVGMTGPINIVFTLYKNMEDLIQPQLNAISFMPSLSTPIIGEGYYSAGAERNNNSIDGSVTSTVRVVNSKIIAASINSTNPRRRLTEPVWFTLQHLEPTSNGKPLCSFWDMDTSSVSGQWSQDGCRLVDTNTTHTTCECDHLTNFAVLMDITGVTLSQENELALRVITFVGCVISVVCLMLSWITFLVFKNLQCDRNTIHRNLVFSLLLAEITFLVGIAQTEPKILCSIIAGILHYLFLSAFAWMCLEGIQLYIMLVEVFEQEKSRVHWYYLFGYGAPAVVVAVSAGVYHEGYGTIRHCWLSTENYFIWSFVGPALAVMLINIGMLSIAIYTMCRHSLMSVTTRERSKATEFRSWVKGAIILVVLLGLTWLLGVLYLNEESVVIAYFFTVLNSLQGLFIFVFHCLKNEKVQKEYRKVARRTSWLPDCIRVNYGGYTGMASNSQVGSSDSKSYLSKLFGQKRTGLSTVSTSSSAKPFLSKDQQRRSDTENSTSRESSNIPSSLNGYVYNPNYSFSGNTNANSPFLSKNHGEVRNTVESRPVEVDNSYETVDEMAAECCVVGSSQCMDCCVVDSEFVPEYCRHNIQVSREETAYSIGSEDSYRGKPVNRCNNMHIDNLCTPSFVSGSLQPSPCMSNAETLNRSSNGDLEKGLEKHLGKEPADSRLNLHRYVIPATRKNSSSNKHVKNITAKPRKADVVNASMSKISNPFPSHCSILEAQASPRLSSSPDPEFRQDITEPALRSSATN